MAKKGPVSDVYNAADHSDILLRAVEDAPSEVFAFDASTLKFTIVNEKARSNLQYSLEELRQLTPVDIKPEFDEPSFRNVLERLTTGQEDNLTFRTQHIRRDGTGYEAEISLQYIANGQPQFLALILDVTAENQAQVEILRAKDQLRTAIEALPDGFVLYDRRDRLVICNEKYKEFYPKSASAMVPGAKFKNILRLGLAKGEYLDAVGREKEWLKERLKAHRQANDTVEQCLSGGRWIRILERVTPDGGRVGLRIDITKQVESRDRAEQAEQRLTDAINALPAAFWLFDADDKLILLNDHFNEIHPASTEILAPGATYEEILRFGLERGHYPTAIGDEDTWLAGMLDLHRIDGSEHEYELDQGSWVRALTQRTSEGGQVGFRIDITELKRKQIELEQTAATDSLTGLANRRGVTLFSDRAARSLKPNERLIVLHVDLDKFKSINDAIGHDAGDYVLVEAAKKLRANATKGGLVARVGGDEFLVLLQSDMTDSEVLDFSETLRCELTEPIRFRGRICHIGASIGISSWHPTSKISIETALQNADIALNQCKSLGRSRSSLFEQSMREHSVKTAVLAQEINNGIKDGEFVPFFQPQFDISGKNIDGFEVLVRWNHPTRGLLSAGEFLFASEETGLVSAIDRIVLQKSLPVVQHLNESGMDRPRISLNMSSAQLSDPGIVEQYMWQIQGHGLAPDQVRIEILESTLLDDRSVNVIENIHAFAENGLAIELDDFGTGHTAIASLRQFPVRRIKIDRSLVQNIDSDPELFVITGAIVGLARKLGIKVLAEGVETAKELEALQKIGCTCVQGYHLARPMSEQNLFHWLHLRGDIRSVA